MNRAIKVFAVTAIGFVVSANVACTRGQAKRVSVAAVQQSGPKSPQEIAELKDVFGKIDTTYDYDNKTLASKIESVTLDAPVLQADPNNEAVGFVRGTVKVKGVQVPVGFYSQTVNVDQLKEGVAIETQGDAKVWEEHVGGQVTGTVKCLDEKCVKVAVYFRMIQGAGYIFQADQNGYVLVNKN